MKDESGNALSFENEQDKKIFWHTSSHVLANAVKNLYPNAKLAIGPAIDSGFYYDFDIETAFTPENLTAIEKEMRNIIKKGLRLERKIVSRQEAITLMQEKGEVYKIELINDLPEGEEISLYYQGDFVDLCTGPHLGNVAYIKALKLLSCTGAYFKGDSNNKSLQRIYGVSFPDAQQLTEHLTKLEEAKKRDHNKLGRELGFFTTVDYIGQGLPILMPKGARVMQLLQRFVEDEEEKRGYQLTKTPFFAKKDLYEISGHWQHYRDGMFIMGNEDEGECYALRPMTCPFQFQVYLSKGRSYRDLPMRLNETATLFRNESSGEMHGLIRVRQFTLSEGHIACLPNQLEEEFKGCVDLALFMLKTIGLDDDVYFRFSKWDSENKDKYIGDAGQWDDVQNKMRDILNSMELEYTEADGEAAFYGPKLDIQIKNVHGKEDTLITIQIDFQLAERFGMEYTDADGTKKFPFIIHRSSIGCYERTLALLIEKYAGALPLWLSPVQVKLLPIGDLQQEYAEKVAQKLKDASIRCEIDGRNEKIGYKIRESQLDKIPYMLIIGDNEVQNGTVSARSRKNGDMGEIRVDALITELLAEITSKS